MFNGVYGYVFLNVCVWPCSLTCEIALLDLKLLLFAKIIYESFNFCALSGSGLVHY